ncbi:hypothetical protein IV38_GL000433 [Lactobacillus selangorensis]|uniref:Uncharacterized protein n=1 Tax=Lactobacillus selangorensis TaxID=81857 RepID=A0A0R2FZJ2_9LACO|nr:hypothetical protein IV38_GL000433 [Lactobacillus selangorensis]KRN33922.1 hypothetical protein IV40_GL000235 [Lactobacillus selangorensis]
MARSNQYSQKQLASFYNQISEAVIAPLKDLHYGVSQDHLKTTLTTQQKKLSAIGLKLANNTAQQQATQDLGNYTKTAQSVLTAMKNNDQNSFTAAMKSFNNETNSIAKRDFSNQIPQSFRDYITLEKQDQSISSVATSSSQK